MSQAARSHDERSVRWIAGGRGIWLGPLMLALVVLSACSMNQAMRPDSYTVRPGDTLSGIGARYGIDWHRIARWNHIAPPYQIQVGERLALKPFPPLNYNRMHAAGSPAPAGTASSPGAQNTHRIARSQSAARSPAQSAQSQSRSDSQASSQERTHALPSRALPQVQQQNAGVSSTESGSSQSPASSEAGSSSASGPSKQGMDAAVASASRAPAKTTHAAGPSKDGWQWPADGKVIQSYDPSAHHRGIEIGGHVGDPVRAASSGRVVYNGTGLKGYGRLIIIKHNAHYLSAYGFNKRSLVKQGDSVKAGQHIADMGLGPGKKAMLHFEIRRDGDPIDPGKLLPSR